MLQGQTFYALLRCVNDIETDFDIECYDILISCGLDEQIELFLMRIVDDSFFLDDNRILKVILLTLNELSFL